MPEATQSLGGLQSPGGFDGAPLSGLPWGLSCFGGYLCSLFASNQLVSHAGGACCPRLPLPGHFFLLASLPFLLHPSWLSGAPALRRLASSQPPICPAPSPQPPSSVENEFHKSSSSFSSGLCALSGDTVYASVWRVLGWGGWDPRGGGWPPPSLRGPGLDFSRKSVKKDPSLTLLNK